MTVTVQEGINEVDTGIEFDLKFNYDDDDSDYKDSTECRLTILNCFGGCVYLWWNPCGDYGDVLNGETR